MFAVVTQSSYGTVMVSSLYLCQHLICILEFGLISVVIVIKDLSAGATRIAYKGTFIGSYMTIIGFMQLIRVFISVIGIIWLL